LDADILGDAFQPANRTYQDLTSVQEIATDQIEIDQLSSIYQVVVINTKILICSIYE